MLQFVAGPRPSFRSATPRRWPTVPPTSEISTRNTAGVPGCRVVFCRFRTQQLRMTLCGLVPARKTGKENVENNLASALQKFREVLFVALSVNLLAVAVRLFCAILAVPPF